jgi:hypothetical protein
MKAQRGGRSSTLSLTSAVWVWVVNATPRPLYPQERDTVAIVQEAGWAPGPVWTGAKNLAPTGIRSAYRPRRSESLCTLCYPRPPMPSPISFLPSIQRRNATVFCLSTEKADRTVNCYLICIRNTSCRNLYLHTGIHSSNYSISISTILCVLFQTVLEEESLKTYNHSIKLLYNAASKARFFPKQTDLQKNVRSAL